MTIRIESSTTKAPIARSSTAQRAGKLRYIGFTGHKDPHIHLYMLDVAREHGFLFDTVQMPLNVMDAHYRSFGSTRAAGVGETGNRRPRHEADGERHHSQVEDRLRDRVPSLRAEPADVCGHHRSGLDGDSRSGLRSRSDVPSLERDGA